MIGNEKLSKKYFFPKCLTVIHDILVVLGGTLVVGLLHPVVLADLLDAAGRILEEYLTELHLADGMYEVTMDEDV